MHMADALISTAVGGATIAAVAGLAVYANSKIKYDLNKDKIPLMGVMGAFVFAAQMINFSIPGTGSSGHLAGGILLASMLGPYAGFLAMCAILLIQALFFADGGLLALGCNILNMGFFACFIAYPLIFKPVVMKGFNNKRIVAASLLSSVAALQLGAFAVVLETLVSGKTQLPFLPFAALMQPIHLAIGVAEGLITSAILMFVWKARPETLQPSLEKPQTAGKTKKMLIVIIIATLLIAGGLFYFASADPDGLEWSVFKLVPNGEIQASGFGNAAADIQKTTSVFADYGSANGTQSYAGIIGAVFTLVLIVVVAVIVRAVAKKKKNPMPKG